MTDKNKITGNAPAPESIQDFLAAVHPNETFYHLNYSLLNVWRGEKTLATQKLVDMHPEADWYFQPAVLRADFDGKKSSKEDVDGSFFAWVDMDPPKQLNPEVLGRWRRETLQKLRESNEFSFIIDSGRGYWGFVRLTSIVDRATLEKINKGLCQQFDADRAATDCCRVARLPFTRNSKTGEMSSIVHWTDTKYPPDSMAQRDDYDPAPAPKGGQQKVKLPRSLPAGILPEQLFDANNDDDAEALDIILNFKQRMAERQASPDVEDKSRSPLVFKLLCLAVRKRIDPEKLAAVLLHKDNEVSDYFLNESAGKARPNPRKKFIHDYDNAVDSENANPGGGEEVPPPQWGSVNKDGNPRPSYFNARVALTMLGHSFVEDTFANRKLINGELLTDDLAGDLRNEVQAKLKLELSFDNVFSAAKSLCHDNQINPPLEYVESLDWDGEPRLDTWMITYLGAEDTPYVRAVSRLFLIAAVRRLRKPGCKYDTVLILESPQGFKKSMLIEILATEAWSTDTLSISAPYKTQVETMQGAWILEIGELQGLRKTELGVAKAFITRRIDKARLAYERSVREFPRQCVFVGTTNEANYLDDSTGSRRFLPIRVKYADELGLKAARDQLFAEAAVAEAAGEEIWLKDPSLAAAANEATSERSTVLEDPWYDRLARMYLPNLPCVAADEFVASETLINLLVAGAEKQTFREFARVKKIMLHMGWEGPKPIKVDGEVHRGYRRPKVTGVERNLRGDPLPPKGANDGQGNLGNGGNGSFFIGGSEEEGGGDETPF